MTEDRLGNKRNRGTVLRKHLTRDGSTIETTSRVRVKHDTTVQEEAEVQT